MSRNRILPSSSLLPFVLARAFFFRSCLLAWPKTNLGATLAAVLGLACIVLAGCSSNLTRGRAQDVLGQQLTKTYTDDSVCLTPRDADESRILRELQDEGLVTAGTPASLTEKGKAYATTAPWADSLFTHTVYVKVKTATIAFGEITGMTGQGSGMAKVEYTLVFTPTPFGKVTNQWHHNSPGEAWSRPESAWFQKYDDGWRLQRKGN